MIHFDEHIFEMGWFNHQLGNILSFLSAKSGSDLFFFADSKKKFVYIEWSQMMLIIAGRKEFWG